MSDMLDKLQNQVKFPDHALKGGGRIYPGSSDELYLRAKEWAG